MSSIGEQPSPNRLIHEHSPYLRQHAHNPVDWYPWGEEAWQRARQENKPVLLSIGYSACHWCHVMERESFEDAETAALMNHHFVNIKVDREERPDLDSIYMGAVVAITGRGGWPMTVFLMPDGTPFYGGTYFPPKEKAAHYGIPSFQEVLQRIAKAYHTGDAANAAQEIRAHLLRSQAFTHPRSANLPDASLFEHALQSLRTAFDWQHGGFGGAPKFPQPMTLEFLLRMAVRTGNPDARAMLDLTLHKMAMGGIYDQLGGGFHRYSVDATWLTPHFEKMLYDNALLARLYAEAFQATGEAEYQRIAEETCDYLLREMRHNDGGFYSTQDADSEGKEGAFFVWTYDQVREVLGEDTLLFCQLFDITRGGNFEEGTNILHMPRPLADIAHVTGVSEERLAMIRARGCAQLWRVREQRIKPALDDKIIVAWNGMVIRAFAIAAGAFGRSDYLDVARTTADFLLSSLRRADGRLLRIWKDGATAIPAFLDDYAMLADGLLALYRIDGDWRWLNEAHTLADEMLRLFWDETLGGFYDTATDHEQLITRPRDISDNAVPSGNAVAIEVLLQLAVLTAHDRYRTCAEQCIRGAAEVMHRAPTAFGRMLAVTDMACNPMREVLLVGDLTMPDMHELCRVIQRDYLPNVIVAYSDLQNPPPPEIAARPLWHERTQPHACGTAYVCEQFLCQAPVTDATALRQQLHAGLVSLGDSAQDT